MEHSSELTLSQLNLIVRDALYRCFPDKYWVRAELSEVRVNYSGHCYLEFVEKDLRTSQIVAKARGNIWANRWRVIKPYFEQQTNQEFASGIKVLVEVSVEFHEIYGYSLVVNDIDPTYTIGDMAKNRAEILRKLEEAGVKDLNKELELPELPSRLAVISSASAAGYGDFMNQIENNTYGYAIYTHLFPAIMQGASAKKSIIMALQKIYEYLDNFDAVIIIRGGGATSDLNCFDDFDLAYNCAQFPLPIITGIGHERDTTVLDEISCIRVKTPTAAAEYIIERFDTAYSRLNNITAEIKNIIVNVSERENRRLALIAESIPNIVRQRIVNEKARVEYVRVRIPQLAQSFIGREQTKLEILAERMKNIIPTQIEKERTRLNNIEKIIELTSPDNVIKKGYSLTLLNGKVLRSIDDVKPGDKIETVLIDGNIKSKVY